MSSAPNAVPRMRPVQTTQDYPYPWIYPPDGSKPFDFVNAVPLPAEGTAATIITFTVRPGYNGIIRAYAADFNGAGFTSGSGSVFWQILHKNGLTPFQYYNHIVSSLGNVANPPYHPFGLRVLENEVIVLAVNNVSIVPAGQLVEGRLMGWFYPKKYDNPNIRA